jgi:hypothetical protein
LGVGIVFIIGVIGGVVAEEVEEGWVVAFGLAGEDAEADCEEVDLGGEVVVSGGGDEGFAEFAEGGEDLG